MTAYRITILLVSFGAVYMGYRLFMAGVYEKAGDLKAAFGDKNLTLRQAAPGTFFSLFGCVILVVALINGFTIDYTKDGGHVVGKELKATEPTFAFWDNSDDAAYDALLTLATW
jgi:hypothetical protein